MSRSPSSAGTDAVSSKPATSRSGYWEWTANPGANHTYLVPGVLEALRPFAGARVLDIGCGNGALTACVNAAGFDVTGMDFEPSGLAHGQRLPPSATA